MEEWATELNRGRPEAAWDLFLGRYRRLLFAAIRHYAEDYDDVMDVFARVCEALREEDLRRLRSWVEHPDHRAKFSTWLVTVVRRLTIDWFRARDGRQRISVVAERLPPLQRQIFEQVFLQRRSHLEAYELIRSTDFPALSFKEYLAELRATYRGVTDGRRGLLLRELGGPPLQAEPADSDPAQDTEYREALEEALRALSPEDRLAVELYVQEGLPASAIATILGLPTPKAVYNRVYRALAEVRTRLEQAGIRRGNV